MTKIDPNISATPTTIDPMKGVDVKNTENSCCVITGNKNKLLRLRY